MSAGGKEYSLAIRIAGMVDRSFNTSLNSAKKELSGLEKARKRVASLESGFSKLDPGFDRIGKAGMACFSGIAKAAGAAAAAVGAATGVSVNIGMEFESAFAGVKKTVDAMDEEYGRLREDILGMAREMPSSAAEIAGVMEIAGQLGIARESLAGFTETMINMGVSTNLSSEEASTSLAKFANIVNMADYGEDGTSNWERLGSVVVDLGNHFATTEADIVEMATRLASTGELVGLTEAQIMALSTSMSSVGIGEEAGGSSMSKLLKKMQMATELGSESLEEYASVAGMTSAEFTEAFQKDAVEALSAFIGGLNDVERNGKSAIVIMDDLGLTEVRLSNTIQSLANADGVMSEAIQTANAAWDESTALAEEAGKRYETAESKVQLMGNAFKELGIHAYDDLREPFVDAIGTVTGKVHEFDDYIKGANGLKKWMGEAEVRFPTLQRKFRKFAEPVFSAMLDFGKWTIKNGQGIVSVIAGIGGAFATYKLASTVTHIADSILGLTKGQWAISGVMTAIGGLVAAYAAYKQHEQDLVDRNLADHFGSIALSMEELRSVAGHIIDSESLGGVRKALDAFKDLGDISASMEDSVSEVDKLNWKISIGMELTEEENESYKQAIDEYVKSAQDYALQSQYAVSLNLQVAFSEGDLEGQDVAAKVNRFYQDKYDELSSLGTQLNEALTDAFNDGLLDIKETKVIADIQRQMAEIEEAMATGEFDARLSVLGMEYAGGGSLTADSFMNLQKELADQVAEASSAYQESYTKNYAAIQAAYAAGDYLDEAGYQKALESLQAQYLENVGEIKAKSVNFQLETIMAQYAGEIDPAIEGYIQQVQETMESYAEKGVSGWMDAPVTAWTSMLQSFDYSDMDKTTRQAIGQLLEAMLPSIEEMKSMREQYEAVGKEIPESFITGLSSFAMLDVLSQAGLDYESVGNVLGEQLVNSGQYESFYREMMEELEGLGYYVPEEVARGAANTAAMATAENVNAAAEASVRPAVDGVYRQTQQIIDECYAQNFQATADVEITLNPILRGSMSGLLGGSLGNVAKTMGGLGSLDIDRNADGGIIRNKELSWLAEKGPEAVIPLDGSRNAISLWEEAGRLLGMEGVFDGIDLGSSEGATVQYSPVLNFYGAAPSRDDVTEALEISQNKFDSMMDRYFKSRSRVSF